MHVDCCTIYITFPFLPICRSYDSVVGVASQETMTTQSANKQRHGKPQNATTNVVDWKLPKQKERTRNRTRGKDKAITLIL